MPKYQPEFLEILGLENRMFAQFLRLTKSVCKLQFFYTFIFVVVRENCSLLMFGSFSVFSRIIVKMMHFVV